MMWEGDASMSPAAVSDGPAVQAGVRRDRDEPAAQYVSSPDSPLERNGFELPVPRERMATVPSLRALSISLKLFGFRRRTCRPQGPKFRIHFRSSSESSELRSRDRRPERRDLGFGADRVYVARWPARRRLLDWAIRAG